MSPSSQPKRKNWKSRVTYNLNYKFLSLLVTLILWVAAIGKKDFEQIVKVEIQPLVVSGLNVVDIQPKQFEVKLYGKRKSLMKIDELKYTLNLSNYEPGTHIEALDLNYLPLPVGVGVRDNRPKIVKFTLE